MWELIKQVGSKKQQQKNTQNSEKKRDSFILQRKYKINIHKRESNTGISYTHFSKDRKDLSIADTSWIA